MLEITIISAQELKTPSFCFFSHHLKPFITITTFPLPSSSSPSSCNSIKGCSSCHVYSTMIDDVGGPNPTWGDKFLLPLDPTFFTPNNYSCVNLQLFTKRALLGPSLLGWVQIPASDIFDGPLPLGLARRLSYRVRERDGSSGHGVVNVACRFLGELPVIRQPFAAVDTWQTVTGIPVTALPMRTKCT
ncbi:BON1-associated protein 2 [Bienertia sinuspersici]